MKIILIIVVIMLSATACKDNKNLLEVTPHEYVRKMPDVAEKEISLGEATTNILDTGINRVSNIKLACSAISGMSLNAGEEFSFNKTVGKRSRDRGYKDAPIIFHGEKSYGNGGGICQVSSTLYMAAKAAGLSITERHSHSERIAYAPGTDATVVYGEKDMRFKNNTEDILYIYTWVENDMVYAKIVKKECSST